MWNPESVNTQAETVKSITEVEKQIKFLSDLKKQITGDDSTNTTILPEYKKPFEDIIKFLGYTSITDFRQKTNLLPNAGEKISKEMITQVISGLAWFTIISPQDEYQKKYSTAVDCLRNYCGAIESNKMLIERRLKDMKQSKIPSSIQQELESEWWNEKEKTGLVVSVNELLNNSNRIKLPNNDATNVKLTAIDSLNNKVLNFSAKLYRAMQGFNK